MTAIIKDSYAAARHTVDRFSRKEGERGRKKGRDRAVEVERMSDSIGPAYPRQRYRSRPAAF
jgi:hypothetical protein